MSGPRCGLHTVHIPSGPGVTWPIAQRSNPWAGVAVARIAPDTTTDHQLVQDLLDGLGCDADVSSWTRSYERDLDAVTVRFAAHPITHLVILDAQQLDANQLALVTSVAAITATTVWLCEEQPDDRYLRVRDQWPTTPATIDELFAAIGEPETVEPPPAFPDVVGDGPVTFLAACRDRLHPDDFEVVAERFDRARTATVAWAAGTDTLDEQTVVGWLRTQINDCRTLPEMLTVVRATQVALLSGRQRHWLQVELPRLLATAERPPEAAVNDPATWRALGAYRDPLRAAACVLAATGAGIDEICALTLDRVANDGRHVTFDDDTTFAVWPAATVFLRALHLWHTLEGAGPDDLAFVDNEKPLRWRRVVRYVRAAADELGLMFTTRTVTRARPDQKQWQYRWGVSVQEL